MIQYLTRQTSIYLLSLSEYLINTKFNEEKYTKTIFYQCQENSFVFYSGIPPRADETKLPYSTARRTNSGNRVVIGESVVPTRTGRCGGEKNTHFDSGPRTNNNNNNNIIVRHPPPRDSGNISRQTAATDPVKRTWLTASLHRGTVGRRLFWQSGRIGRRSFAHRVRRLANGRGRRRRRRVSFTIFPSDSNRLVSTFFRVSIRTPVSLFSFGFRTVLARSLLFFVFGFTSRELSRPRIF